MILRTMAIKNSQNFVKFGSNTVLEKSEQILEKLELRCNSES